MNCVEFENHLNEQFGCAGLAPHADAAVELAEHAGDCPACRAIWEQYRLLSESIDVWLEHVPEVDLTGAVVSAEHARRVMSVELSPPVAGHGSAQGNRSIKWLPRTTFAGTGPAFRSVCLATGLLVALAATAFILSGRHDQNAMLPNELAGSAPSREVAPVRLPGKSGQPSSAERRAQHRANAPELAPAGYFALAQEAAGALGDAVASVVPRSTPPMPPAEPAPAESAGWIDGLEHQLKPIGRSLGNAFDFLWQAGEAADGSRT